MNVTPAIYARWRATLLGQLTERAEIEAVFDLTGPLAGRRVLDVGAGDGTYGLEAAARGASVTALDVDPAMLDAARARAARRGVALERHTGRAEALPFGDAEFDVVLAVTMLCFVPDAQTAIGEMARVLRPGGRLVLGELNRRSVWAAQRRLRCWLGSESWRRAHFWTRHELQQLARAAGLGVVRARAAVFFPPSGLAARAMAPLDLLLARLRAPGAAFLALVAEKPEGWPACNARPACHE